jgi:hypothetical protein
VQNQRDYLPSLDISTNRAKQQNNTRGTLLGFGAAVVVWVDVSTTIKADESALLLKLTIKHKAKEQILKAFLVLNIGKRYHKY